MDASSGKNELNTPFKLTGLDLMFGMPRSEWVTLYEKVADIERGIASMERVLDDFSLLRGRLVKRGDHLYVDHLDAGVHVEIIESEHPAPEMGPDIYPLLANGLLPEMPPAPLEDQESRPLAAFRYIRYSDGRLTVGSSISHALVDASAVTLFFLACRKAFFDEPYPKPVTDRSIILKLADEGSDKPSAKSGLMLKPFDPQLFATERRHRRLVHW